MGGDGSTRWWGHRRRWCIGEGTYPLAARTFAEQLREASPYERLAGRYCAPGGVAGSFSVGLPGDGGWRWLVLTADDASDGPRRVVLEPGPQRFGGVRWWLRCPLCGSRRATLYLTRWTG